MRHLLAPHEIVGRQWLELIPKELRATSEQWRQTDGSRPATLNRKAGTTYKLGG